MKSGLLFALGCLVTLTAHAIELAPCSFPGEPGAFEPRCAKQTIDGHSVEIAKLPPYNDVFVAKIDDGETKRFKISDYKIIYGWPVPFLVNAETLVLADKDSLSFYKIPSILQINDGSTLSLKYKDRLSYFFLTDESGNGLRTENAEQFASLFEIGAKGVFLGKKDQGAKTYINYKVDSGWVDSEYLKMALLDAAHTRYVMWGQFDCEYSYAKHPKKQRKCMQKAKTIFDAAVAAIKEGKPQTYVGPGLESTALGQFYTSPSDGAEYGLGITVSNIGTPSASVRNWFLMINNPGGGKNARLDLERDNPYLKLVQ
ncbi:MAG: hypothetical protein HYW27_00520 [Candidatus Aenigmarchaeota archaeon]|nr:hypothetical protein [Candidatus Aenigmarchaeota archaeon]